MKALLANDLVIQEDNCNLSCQYCLTGQSNFKPGHESQMIFGPPRPSSYSCGSDLTKRLDAIIAATAAGNNLPIVKVTGGEIFLVRGIMDLIRQLVDTFATVVIQTNASLLTPEIITEIAGWSTVCLQVSLDGVSYEGNGYRCINQSQHDHVMNRLFSALDARIPTEIYCVLNDRSLPELEHTLEAFLPYSGRVVVNPFPVRGPDRTQFAPRVEQIDVLRRIAARYERYAGVLPPRPYLTRLLRFFDEGERSFRCHLPRFAFTTFDDGVLTSCPNIWFNKIGNLLSEDPADVMARIGHTGFYQVLLGDKPRIDACKACFTPWDTLSMYVDGEITLDELCRPPSMYSAPASRARIAEIAGAYRETACSRS